MGGNLAAQFGAPVEAEAVDRRGAVGEAHWSGQAGIQRVRIVARRVDVAFPGDHVVKRGAEPGVPGP